MAHAAALSECASSDAALERGIQRSPRTHQCTSTRTALLQELLARARRRGFRINLRPLADVRNLCWIPIAYYVVLYGLRFVWWLVVAIATGAAESSSSSAGSGGGMQRQHHQHQHQEY